VKAATRAGVADFLMTTTAIGGGGRHCEAKPKQSIGGRRHGLLRRSAPCNDGQGPARRTFVSP